MVGRPSSRRAWKASPPSVRSSKSRSICINVDVIGRATK